MELNDWETSDTMGTDEASGKRGRTWAVLTIVVLACVSAGWVGIWWGYQHIRRVDAPPADAVPAHDPALRYAAAVQDGDCELVVAMARSMQDRLRYVQSTSGQGNEYALARDALCEDLQSRPVEGNLLAPEGIEDKYVFPPGARIEWLRRDAGRQTLDSPVAHRTWLRVSYPIDRYAPRGVDGRAIRAMDVGVNVSPDGSIVKAEIVGNLDVDRSSLQWLSPVP